MKSSFPRGNGFLVCCLKFNNLIQWDCTSVNPLPHESLQGSHGNIDETGN